MRNQTRLLLPFVGEWFVYWGGDTENLNYHHKDPGQRYAFDFVRHDNQGRSHKGDGTKNEDYYAFGADVLAPADGVIVDQATAIRDNAPQQTNRFAAGGNYLLIKHNDSEYSFIGHLRQNTTAVKIGDKVKAGQKLGECGNSGNSSEPHIHYHLQNSDIHSAFSKTRKPKLKAVAKGIKTYFTNVRVLKNKKYSNKSNYSPRRGDMVRTISSQG